MKFFSEHKAEQRMLATWQRAAELRRTIEPGITERLRRWVRPHGLDEAIVRIVTARPGLEPVSAAIAAALTPSLLRDAKQGGAAAS